MSSLYRSARRLAPLALALLAAACDSSKGEAEPEVDSMRITIAGQAPITVNATGVQSGTLNLVAGSPSTITVEFLDATGASAIAVPTDEYQVQVTPGASSGISFTRTGAFTGTLNATLIGTGRQVGLALLHIPESHEDFGPFNVNFNVTGAAVAAK